MLGSWLVAGVGGRGPGGGRVDQSSIRAGRPWCRAAGAAQSSRRPLQPKAMTPTERALCRPPATISRRRGRHGSRRRRAGRPSTGVSSRRASATRAILGPRGWVIWAAKRPSWGSRMAVVAASTSIQRSHREPCLVMWPRRVWASLVRSPGSARPKNTTAQVRGSGRCPRPRRPRWPPSPARPGDRQQPPHPRVAGEACPQVGVGMGDLDGDGVDQAQAGIESTTSRSRHG
jgi:hypothetical protein